MTVQRYVKYFKYQNHLNISTLQRLAYFKYFFLWETKVRMKNLMLQKV